jgi:hypothetical protein
MRTMETGDDLERLLLVLVVVQVQLQHDLLHLADGEGSFDCGDSIFRASSAATERNEREWCVLCILRRVVCLTRKSAIAVGVVWCG